MDKTHNRFTLLDIFIERHASSNLDNFDIGMQIID